MWSWGSGGTAASTSSSSAASWKLQPSSWHSTPRKAANWALSSRGLPWLPKCSSTCMTLSCLSELAMLALVSQCGSAVEAVLRLLSTGANSTKEASLEPCTWMHGGCWAVKRRAR